MSENINILDRVLEEAYYVAQTGSTVRKTASVFNISKSTVHKDMAERLYYVDKELFGKVRKVLDINLKERHIRGGEATRLKYQAKNIKTEK